MVANIAHRPPNTRKFWFCDWLDNTAVSYCLSILLKILAIALSMHTSRWLIKTLFHTNQMCLRSPRAQSVMASAVDCRLFLMLSVFLCSVLCDYVIICLYIYGCCVFFLPASTRIDATGPSVTTFSHIVMCIVRTGRCQWADRDAAPQHNSIDRLLFSIAFIIIIPMGTRFAISLPSSFFVIRLFRSLSVVRVSFLAQAC